MPDLGDIIGSGARMDAIREFIRLNASDATPLLVTGEPGTGRKLIADIVRGLSPTGRVVTIGEADQAGMPRLELPPLRQRKEDIAPLTEVFLARASHASGRPLRPISPSARLALEAYHWPGNVRELQETCDWLSRTCTCPTVRRGCLPARLQRRITMTPTSVATHQISLDDQLRELEARLISRALMATGYNRSQAARLLSIKRSTLGDRIQRLGLARALGEEVA